MKSQNSCKKINLFNRILSYVTHAINRSPQQTYTHTHNTHIKIQPKSNCKNQIMNEFNLKTKHEK